MKKRSAEKRYALKRGVIAIIFVSAFTLRAGAFDFNEDTYGSLADYLNGIYGESGIGNNGLTSFPILNIPMGGSSEAMASAYSAVANDISFIEFNPAGSSMLNHTELAFFHNNWIADTRLESVLFATRYNNFGFAGGGKWLYTPFTEYNMYGERVSKGYYSEGVAVLNFSYNFLSSYYFSGISAGLSVKGAFRIVPDYTDADDRGAAEGHSNGTLIPGSGASQSAAMAMADIGFLTRFDFLKSFQSRDRNMAAALVVRNLGPPALGDPLPSVASAAISYKPLRPILLSFEFSVPFNMVDINLSEPVYWSAGISADIASFLSMRAGLLAKAGNIRIAIGSAIKLEKISLDINYTLDLLTQFTPLNRISLGVRFNLGDQGRQELNSRVEELYLAGLGAYAQENFNEASSFWEEALRLNPQFEPAREALASLKNSIRVRDRIEDIQRIGF
ncbi:hypothetical protein FACS1894151_03150 [Spirochaetia bacterium]|nr:hypothetical protein FACS1894151_03150 [Spirochaetia bacterium]